MIDLRTAIRWPADSWRGLLGSRTNILGPVMQHWCSGAKPQAEQAGPLDCSSRSSSSCLEERGLVEDHGTILDKLTGFQDDIIRVRKVLHVHVHRACSVSWPSRICLAKRPVRPFEWSGHLCRGLLLVQPGGRHSPLCPQLAVGSSDRLPSNAGPNLDQIETGWTHKERIGI